MGDPQPNRPANGGLLPPVYIDGYLTKLIDRGERPDYGYPENHLPEAVLVEMNLTTGYMAHSMTDKTSK
jgi:hypothetical protein